MAGRAYRIAVLVNKKHKERHEVDRQNSINKTIRTYPPATETQNALMYCVVVSFDSEQPADHEPSGSRPVLAWLPQPEWLVLLL